MASNYQDTTLWRLRSNNGIVPFKLLSVEGDFEAENGVVTLKCLIPADALVQFLLETFPPPVVVGNLVVPQNNGLPGLPALTARKVSFKSQDDGRPTDPFGFDSGAPTGTYHSVLEVTVEYGLNKNQQPDPTDPFTFLEISGNTTGEFINSTAPGGKWQRRTASTSAPNDSAEPGALNSPQPTPTDTTKEVIKDPTIPVLITVPQTEWTVKWNQIPFEYFRNCLIWRLRWCLGRVNSVNFPLLFNAEPQTVLFTGYNYTQQYTWRDGYIGTPPINLEMKFVEKRVIWDGMVAGWNHAWRPGKGWEYLLIDGVNPMYSGRDMTVLFRV